MCPSSPWPPSQLRPLTVLAGSIALLIGCNEFPEVACIDRIDDAEPADAAAFLTAFEGTATPDNALPAFVFDLDEANATGRITTFKNRCSAPDQISAEAPVEIVDARGGTGSGTLHFGDVTGPGSLFQDSWSASPTDIAWLREEAEAVLGPLGPVVETRVDFHWPDHTLAVTAHFEDPSVEGGARQVGAVEVPAYATTFEFAPSDAP